MMSKAFAVFCRGDESIYHLCSNKARLNHLKPHYYDEPNLQSIKSTDCRLSNRSGSHEPLILLRLRALLRSLRSFAPIPNNPVPSRTIVAGSGTDDCVCWSAVMLSESALVLPAITETSFTLKLNEPFTSWFCAFMNENVNVTGALSKCPDTPP